MTGELDWPGGRNIRDLGGYTLRASNDEQEREFAIPQRSADFADAARALQHAEGTGHAMAWH